MLELGLTARAHGAFEATWAFQFKFCSTVRGARSTRFSAQTLFSSFLEVHGQGTTAFIPFSKDPGKILPRLCRYAVVFSRRSVSRCRRTWRIDCVQTLGTARILCFVYVYHCLSTVSQRISNTMALKWGTGTPSPMPKQRPAARLRGQAMRSRGRPLAGSGGKNPRLNHIEACFFGVGVA